MKFRLLVILILVNLFSLRAQKSLDRLSLPPAGASVVVVDVTPNHSIRIGLKAGLPTDTAWIETEAGSAIKMPIKDEWLTQDYSSPEGKIKIYGNITEFDCSSNYNFLTALDVSGNTGLKGLWCSKNSLTVLDVSQDTLLEQLSVWDNNIASISLSNNALLKSLSCNGNALTELNLTNNTQLETIVAYNNKLTELDLTQNTLLRSAYLWNNRIDVCALDDIFSSLPECQAESKGKIYIKNEGVTSDTILGSKTILAKEKHWRVLDYNGTTTEDDEEVIELEGNGTGCTSGIEAQNKQELKVYPNPSKGHFVYRSAARGRLYIYDSTGRIVMEKKVIAGENNLFIEQPGLYVLRMQTSSASVSMRLLIM